MKGQSRDGQLAPGSVASARKAMKTALSADPGLSSSVLVVDDERPILYALKRMLMSENIRVISAQSAREALSLLETETVDAAILDYWMPEKDGLWLARMIKSMYPSVVRVMLTGCIELDVVQDALKRGEIYRYLVKPWDQKELIRTINQAVELSRNGSESDKKCDSSMGDYPITLFESMSREDKRRGLGGGPVNDRLLQMFSLVKAVEMRDPYTLGHSSRVATLARWTSQKLDMREKDRYDLELAALLHDVGKLSVPDAVLFKPSRLAGDDMASILQHPVNGEHMLKVHGAAREVLEIVRGHHEDFDGKGYPDRLAGKNIPLGARIVRITDTFDAMYHKRPYRESKDIADIIKEINKCKNRQFDPDLAELFISLVENNQKELKATYKY